MRPVSPALLAQQTTVSGRQQIGIAAVLARPTPEARAGAGAEMLAQMAELSRAQQIVAPGEKIGTVTTWQGEQVELLAARGLTAVILPGETAHRTVELGKVPPDAADHAVGEIRIAAPEKVPPVPIVAAAAIEPPDLWWRLLHPMALLG